LTCPSHLLRLLLQFRQYNLIRVPREARLVVVPIFLAGFFFIYKTFLAVDGARYNVLRLETYRSEKCMGSCYNPVMFFYNALYFLYHILLILLLPLELIVLVFFSILSVASQLLLDYGWSQYEASFQTFVPSFLQSNLSNFMVAILTGLAYIVWFMGAFCVLMGGFAIALVVSAALIGALPFLWGAMVSCATCAVSSETS